MAEMTFEQINRFLVGLVPPRPAELQRMEEQAERTGFPIVGPAAGYYCYQMARLIGAPRWFADRLAHPLRPDL